MTTYLKAGTAWGAIVLVIMLTGHGDLVPGWVYLPGLVFPFHAVVTFWIWFMGMGVIGGDWELVGLVFVGGIFVVLVAAGFVEFLDDLGQVRDNLTEPREVHHYHRITIDRDGNVVEVDDYVHAQ